MDKIFYPDRSATEIAAFINEGQAFFEIVVQHQVDPIFYPDCEPEEVFDLYCEAADFFETVIRCKPNR